MLLNPKRVRGNSGAERPAFDARLPDFVRGPGQAECRKRLSQLSVAIAGVGSVGLAGVDRLSRMGIAALLCADPARFKPASILTHPIVVPSNLDPPKACFGARHAARINPQMDVRYVIGKLEDVSLSVLRKYELMKVATDNLDSVLVLGRQARRLSIPLIREAVEGQTLTAQVAIYSNSSETSPCPVCGFGTWEWASIGKDKRFSCAGGETQSARELTMSIPSHCSLAADLGVQQTVKFVLGLGKPVADTMLSYFGYTNELSVAQLRQNPNCPCDHRAYTQVIVPDKLGKLTMADILNASGLAGDAELNIEAEGYIYAERRACACDLLPPGRFLRIGRHEDTCPACRRPLYPSFHLHTAVTPRVLGERGMRTPLGRLAAGAVQCVIITSSTRGALVFERNAT